MPRWKLPYSGKCEVKLELDIHGTPASVTTILDTGFISEHFGLKLPPYMGTYAHRTFITSIGLANGEPIDCGCIFDAKIVGIENTKLKNPIETGAVFMDGDKFLGMPVIQLFKIDLNGPKREATIRS